MNHHSYGRSLKLAVNASCRRHSPNCPRPHYHYQHQHHPHHQTIPITSSSPSSCIITITTASLHTSPATRTGRTEHPYKRAFEAEEDFQNRYISREDRDFLWTTKSANLKADVRQRKYSSESIFKPNSYDILASFSRKHNTDKVREESRFSIPAPLSAVLEEEEQNGGTSWLGQKAKVEPVGGKRDPEKTKNHTQLFAAIDAGFKNGPEDWPATFYLVACAKAHGQLDPRVRSSSISYLVKRFILGGRHNEVLRLYTEIQNSWLPFEQREADALEYFNALFAAFCMKPTTEHTTVTRVLDTFSSASANFDRLATLHYTTFKAHLTPPFLLFLSTNLPPRESLPAVAARITQVKRPSAGTNLLPKLFSNLNLSLLSSQTLSPSTVTGKQLSSFYKAQSSLYSLLARIPRNDRLMAPRFAEVIFRQALTWEELLEGKKLVLDNTGDSNQIVRLQRSLLKSLHNLSQATPPGSIRARHTVEFLSNTLALLNLRGEPGDVGMTTAIAVSIYSRMGAFTAAEALLDRVEGMDRNIKIPVQYLRPAITNLATEVKAKDKFRRDAKDRGAVIGNRLFGLYKNSLRQGDMVDQGVVRELVGLYAFCGNQQGIREAWEAVRRGGLERVKTKTVCAVLEGLVETGGEWYAKQVLKDVHSAKGTITASMIKPFIDIRPGEVGLIDEAAKIGVDKGIRWETVAYLDKLKRGEENEVVRIWAEALQNCTDEAAEAKKGVISEKTLEQVEAVFNE